MILGSKAIIKDHVDSPFTQYPNITEEPAYKVITNGLWKDVPGFKFENGLSIDKIEETINSIRSTGIQFVDSEPERRMVMWTGPEGHRQFEIAVQDELERIVRAGELELGTSTTSVLPREYLQDTNTQRENLSLLELERTRQLTEEEQIQLLDQISNNDI